MKAGFVALVGRPNVGKSTLLNQILGEKLAIATPRPQTTREKLLGVLHRDQLQIGFVDTPGLHRPSGPGRTRLNQYMVDQAKQAVADVDVVVVLVELETPEPPRSRRPPKKGEEPKKVKKPDPRLDQATLMMLDELKGAGRPMILAINKVDQLRDKQKLLPVLERLHGMGFQVVPISAKTGSNVENLVAEIEKLVPEGEPIFDEDTLTDRAERWFVTEFVREQVFLLTKREVPYSVAVSVDEFEEMTSRTPGKREMRVSATISVDKEAHKRILVGEGGRMIREIGTRARHELGQRFDATVHLTLFVRVDEGWTQSPHKLRELGYEA
jgi:GTP-binding protein Era